MSDHVHGRRAQPATEDLRAMHRKVEAELADGYVEVEITGVTAQRLLCIYATVAEMLYQRTLQSMRSLFRLHPAH